MGKYMKKCKATGTEVAVMEVTHHHHHHHHHHQHQPHVGVRTRARTLAMAGAGTTATTTAAAAVKKRKFSNAEFQFSSSSFIQLPSNSRRKLIINSDENNSTENSSRLIHHQSSCNYPCSSSPDSNHVRTASWCSSNGSISMLANNDQTNCSLISSSSPSPADVDLVGEGFGIENSMHSHECRERRESTPSSNLQASESGDLESTDRLPREMSNSRHRSIISSSTTIEINNKMMMMPTEEELEDFFSAVEKDEQQKQFSERYNFDFVKEVPLEGRYEWVQLTQ